VSPVHIIAASLGGLAEFIGAFLVLRESARLRRSELRQIGTLGRLWDEVKRTIRNPAPVVIGPLSATATSSASATVTVRGPETPDEALQRRITELEDGAHRLRQQLSSETQRLRDQIDAVATGFEKQTGELREARHSDIARAIERERIGTWVFLIGVTFSLVANLVP
jgi:hypothetical protein